MYAAIAATALASFVTLRLAGPLHRLLGRTGVCILARLMGLILAAVEAQFVLDGLAMAGLVGAPRK